MSEKPGDMANIFLAICSKVYYTILTPAGVMELVDVVDSKCASSFIVPAEKVVAIQALFMYNGISKFNIPPAHPSQVLGSFVL